MFVCFSLLYYTSSLGILLQQLSTVRKRRYRPLQFVNKNDIDNLYSLEYKNQ